MRVTILRTRILVPAVVALVLLSLVEAAPKENAEPPELLVLQIGGEQEIAVQVDKPFTALIGGKPVEMKIIARPHRVLDVGGVRFHYPRGFTFEYEKDDESRTWTVEGPSTVLMLFGFAKQDPKETLKRIEEETVQQFGPKTTVSGTKLAIRKRVLNGRRMAIEVSGVKLWQDIFAFDAGRATYAFVIQHLLTDDGESSPETRRVIELLSKTLELR